MSGKNSVNCAKYPPYSGIGSGCSTTGGSVLRISNDSSARSSGSLLIISSGRGSIDGPDNARILSPPRGGR